jgi:hypothetical protein
MSMTERTAYREWIDDHRIFIALCDAGWRGSSCWHVVDWMQYRLRLKYPLFQRPGVINFDCTS